MPDILVRNIDEAIAERIKTLARERNWSINEVIVHILRHSLGLGGEDLVHREIHDVAVLAGTWTPAADNTVRVCNVNGLFEHTRSPRLARLSEVPIGLGNGSLTERVIGGK